MSSAARQKQQRPMCSRRFASSTILHMPCSQRSIRRSYKATRRVFSPTGRPHSNIVRNVPPPSREERYKRSRRIIEKPSCKLRGHSGRESEVESRCTKSAVNTEIIGHEDRYHQRRPTGFTGEDHWCPGHKGCYCFSGHVKPFSRLEDFRPLSRGLEASQLDSLRYSLHGGQ